MSIQKFSDEAKALKEIWDALTGCSIAWEIENKTLDTCDEITSKQSHGTRHGSWDNIPSDRVEECGTQHDGVFGPGNLGGVIYQLGNTGGYFGVVWSDPSIGSAQCGYAYGSKTFVETYVKKWWGTWFNGTEISTAESQTFNYGDIKIKFQPGFDPFKITFSTITGEDIVDSTDYASTITEFTPPDPALLRKHFQ